MSQPPPFDWEKEWPSLLTKIKTTLSTGIDRLREHSLHYDHLAPALKWLFRTTFDGVNLKHLEAMPDDYEEARLMLVRFARIDARIDKPVRRRFWKRVAKDNKPKEFRELASDETFRRIYAMIQANPDATVIYQSDPSKPESNPILEYIQRFEKVPPLLAASLQITAGRIENWIITDVIDYDTPCTRMSIPCFRELTERLSREKSDS
ncbi:hypothetical protein AB0H12_10650 [Actinosynnema sp. NPDC023794]